jgi:hypothetical protein
MKLMAKLPMDKKIERKIRGVKRALGFRPRALNAVI